MNQKGLNTAIEIAKEYFGMEITEEWLVKNLPAISAFYPAADDEFYTKEYGTNDVWWTFQAECESGGIGDTAPRETFGYAIAQILIKQDWPTYGDGQAVADKFYKELKVACDQTTGIEFVANN